MLSRCLSPAAMARLSPWLLAVLLALTAQPRPALSRREHACTGGYQRPHPRGVCGSTLVSIVEHFCQFTMRGGLFAHYMNKRSAEEVNEKMRDILLNKQDALSYLSKRSSGDNTLTCACCYNQCTVMELARYCPNIPSGVRHRNNRRSGHRGDNRSSRRSDISVSRRSDLNNLDDDYR